MNNAQAGKSQKILDTLKQNVELFKELYSREGNELIKQNILRTIILFSCSGIDAVVKQLIIEALSSVIERDSGAQERLREFVKRKLKANQSVNVELLAELLTARDGRKVLIDMLKKELSFDSLQSAEQLYMVASFFNISTEKLIDANSKDGLKSAFFTRNRIVHQMDVDLGSDEVKYYEHTLEEIEGYYSIILNVSQRYIDEVNEKLKQPYTKEYEPRISIQGETLVFHDF